MKLDNQSLARVARSKAARVQAKVLDAEEKLHAANHAMKSGSRSTDAEKLVAASGQTAAAEAQIHEASEELEVVETLLTQLSSKLNIEVPRGGIKTNS